MKRLYRWPWLVLTACLVGGALGVTVWAVWLYQPSRLPRPLSVDSGDQEIAWIHNATGGDTWTTFVIGVKRAEMPVNGTPSGLTVDDSNAFPEESTAVPEVVIGRSGYAGRVRVRWYKVTADAPLGGWVQALAARDPAPLAVIGGWTSDRAHELALALKGQSGWRGDPPLFFITTATVDQVAGDPDDAGSFAPVSDHRDLIDVYPGRSFRFCFTNRQMADALTDYVLQDPTLRPGPAVWPGVRVLGGGAAGPWQSAAGVPDLAAPGATVFALWWGDDPYSGDLCDKFEDALVARLFPPAGLGPTPPGAPRVVRDRQRPIPFSVGRFSRPNSGEAEAVRDLLRQLPPAGERSLVVIPTVSAPARRVLLALSERVPQAGRRLVAVTGDGISVNTLYRDAAWAWPARSIPIPLVLFTHNNPFGWDTAAGPAPPPGYRLAPPNTTEEALLHTTLTRVFADAAFPPPQPGQPPRVADRADRVAAGFRGRPDRFFDEQGNRLGRSGEHVVALRPTVRYGDLTPGVPRPDATLEVYRRDPGQSGWKRVAAVEVRPDRPADGSPTE